MSELNSLLEANQQWAETIKESDPEFFEKLSEMQKPDYLWIGCSDSRISPSSSVGLLPGEMFVHRNVANLVIHTDMNCLSVMQFAVEALHVRHVIVCGHYGCGGVKAAIDDEHFGLIDNWLRHIQDISHRYEHELDSLASHDERFDRLCKLNVIEQVIGAAETTVVRGAWERGQQVAIHGWIYTIADGIYRDLGVTVESQDEAKTLRRQTRSRGSKASAQR
ncbi:MAG: carbonate dehydratase [Acidobacteriota bacterium]